MGVMGERHGPRCGAVWAGAALAASILTWGAAAVAVTPSARPATNDEVALLVLANEARADPAAQGYPANPVAPPLVWKDALGDSAQYHSDDMALNGCSGHNSCNGTAWYKRIERYYAGWVAMAENLVIGLRQPADMHRGWMSSTQHRTNMLNAGYTDFGAGIAQGADGFGPTTFAVEDFGSRGLRALSGIPGLPAGAVLPRIGNGEQRQLIVNYYDSTGRAPSSVRALVGSACVTMTRRAGTPGHGTYAASRTFQGSGCVAVAFEAIKADGARVRWPQNEAVLVGVGSGGASCAERTTAVPTQDCGGGSSPTPTPTPTAAPAPTPTPDGSQLKALRIFLKPGQRDASKGLVQIQATLPRMTDFDPSTASVSIDLSFAPAGDWSESLPVTCGGKPCLKPNERTTVYRAKYGANHTLSFTRAKDGSWKLRYASRNETLDAIGEGTVRLTLRADGRTFTGSADGDLKENGLVAD